MPICENKAKETRSRKTLLAKIIFAMSALMLMSGCGLNTKYSDSASYNGVRVVKSIYLYSFLDIRRNSIGDTFLAEVEKMFNEEFSKRNVRIDQFWFSRSLDRGELIIPPTSKGSPWKGSRSEMQIPISEVLQARAGNERVIDATHRLIIFPYETTSGGMNPHFSIKWDLIDTSTGTINWSIRSHSTTTNFFSSNENSLVRARNFVDDLIWQMERDGVFETRTRAD